MLFSNPPTKSTTFTNPNPKSDVCVQVEFYGFNSYTTYYFGDEEVKTQSQAQRKYEDMDFCKLANLLYNMEDEFQGSSKNVIPFIHVEITDPVDGSSVSFTKNM